MPLVIHAVLQPLGQKELVSRDDMINPSTAKAEWGIRRYQIRLRMDIQHTHIVCELIRVQVHRLDKDYRGHFTKRQNKTQELL